MLDAEFATQLRDFPLAVSLSAEEGGTLVLVGESGSGKTTILNVLAGLLDPDRGRIRLDGETYFDRARGVAIPPHERSVGYVFQEYALFPHLSVYDNIAFGFRAQGISDRELRPRVHEILERLGVAELSASRPTRLSGGQQQRVAVARALVLQPRLLLLDEPMSALDLHTRRQVRTELRRVLAGLPCITIFVTHSPFEAMVFGQRIAVVERGRIAQVGGREDLLRHPRSRYVAELMGVNLFRGRVVARDRSGLAQVETAGGILHVIVEDGVAETFIAVDPNEVTLHTASPMGSAQNVFRGRVAELVPDPPFGERVRVVLDTHPPLVAQVTARAVHTLGLREGLEVYATFKATAASVYG